jgi:hypothetical protein
MNKQHTCDVEEFEVMLFSSIPIYRIDIYVIDVAESNSRFHFPQTVWQV